MFSIHNQYKAQLLLGFIFLFSSCDAPPKSRFKGRTMGTTYEVILGEALQQDNLNIIHSKIDSLLGVINQQMSVYIGNSDISKFNERDVFTPRALPNMFNQVMDRSLHWYAESNGAFDITVMPLVNEWGFGTKEKIQFTPQKNKIESILTFVGSDKLLLENNSLSKTDPNVQIDLGAVAKGFAVDAIGIILTKHNINNYYIEIGGEIKCKGVNAEGKIWTIGIQLPDRNVQNQLIETVSLNNKAIATSGDYKNFIELNGQYYSHSIDPKTGYPVNNNIASVSVIAPNCMDADAIATALMIKSINEGTIWVNSLKSIEAMWVIREKNGIYSTHSSDGFLNN